MKYLLVAVAAAILIAVPPVTANELDDAFAALKEAVSKKDVALVKKLAAETSALAREEAEIEEPSDASLKQAWKERTAWARDVDKFTEYALYTLAVGAEPDVVIDLIETLEKQNPKSVYLDEGGYSLYFAALTKKGEQSKIPALAEKALANLPNSVDLLLVLADDAFAKRQTGRAQTFAQRLVNAASKATKPEGMSQEDWERRRALALGHGYYYMGMIAADSQRFFDADRNLRAALPYIKGNNAMYGPALFALGVANFQLGVQTNNRKRVLEAADLSEQASKIPGAHAQQAWANAQAMRQQAAKMR